MKTSTTQPDGTKPTSFRTLLPYLAAILILIQLVANIFLLKEYLNQRNITTSAKSDKATMEFTSMMLAGKYQEAIDSVDNQIKALKGDNAALSAKYEEQKAELLREKEESARRLREGKSDLNQETARFNQIERKYKDEIASLQNKVKGLEKDVKIKTDQNASLDSFNHVVKDQLEKTTAAAAAEKATAEKAAEDAKRAIAARDAQIENARFVLIPGVTITPLKVKGKNEDDPDAKTKEVNNAKRVDRFSICLTTAPNPLISKGSQKFYLRLLNAAGQPVSMGDNSIKTNSGEVRFALEVEMTYDGTAKQECFTWKPAERLARGKYTLDVFNNGKQVGQGSLVLK